MMDRQKNRLITKPGRGERFPWGGMEESACVQLLLDATREECRSLICGDISAKMAVRSDLSGPRAAI